MRKENFKRHALNPSHVAAQALWEQRLRAEATHGDTVSIFRVGSTTAASATAASAMAASAVSTRTRQPADGQRAVIAVRTLLETSSSYSSFDKWRDALVTDNQRQALESKWHCKRLVSTMALHERDLTQRLLRAGAAFRLQADGLERTYQVEIGTVIWSLPAFLKDSIAHGEAAGWLEALGPKGPWIVERIIGMREFPQSMTCHDKTSMLEASLRKACLSTSGDLDVQLHHHVREAMWAWCSDGADLDVPLAASAFCPNLVFHGWDESHSAQRLMANAMKGDPEIVKTMQILVEGKQPYSLAKFLSTSLVFRKTVGNAQLESSVAFVKKIGWAPQRYTSRSRPLARESRRWEAIFNAVAEEAAGPSEQRRVLARMFLVELGGENSSRLVLGGLLADLAAEHYTWIAAGDARNPDATTVTARAEQFLDRLDNLFDKASDTIRTLLRYEPGKTGPERCKIRKPNT